MANSRKYQRYFKPISHEQFSTAGTMRTQGRIGQTSLSRSIVRTPFRGELPIGYGGSNSEYDVNIVYSCNNSSPSNGQASLTTKGHILSRFINPSTVFNSNCDNHNCGSSQTVKNFNPLEHSHSIYLRKLKVINVSQTAEATPTLNKSAGSDCDNIYMLGTRKKSRNSYHKDGCTGAISSGTYNESTLLRNNCLPSPLCKKSFPFSMNKNGCNIEYKTPEEAINAGILPKDWMKCIDKYPT